VIAAEVGPAEIAYANHRTQYEHFMDFRYLLLGDIQEQRRKALRVHLYASWDFLAYAAKIGVNPAAEDNVRRYLAQLEQEDAQLAATVAAEWKRRWKPSHWSGIGRTAAIRAVNPDPKGNLNDYKWLSWMAHPDMGPVLNPQTIGERRYLVDPFGENSTARIICRKAIRVIFRSWSILNQQTWFQRRGLRDPRIG
jgi:hypothetical protein